MNVDFEQLLQLVKDFLAYACAYPSLYEVVSQKLIILLHTLGGSSVLELTAARDAANSLFMMAREVGYHEMEQQLYLLYEELCALLLSCYQGGSR